MKVKLKRFDITLLISAIASIIVFVYFYADIFPSASIKIIISKKEIEQNAYSFLSELDYRFEDCEAEIDFRRDKKQLKYLGKRFGTSKANQLMADSIVTFYWRIKWDSVQYSIKSSLKDTTQARTSIQSEAFTFEDASLSLAIDGRPVAFKVSIDDSIHCNSLSKDSARTIAEMFLANKFGIHLSAFELQEHVLKKIINRTDHYFKWQSKKAVADEKRELKLTLKGELLSEYRCENIIPEKYREFDKKGISIKGIFIAIIILAYVIFVIILVVKKLKANAISLNIGLIFAVIVTISMIFIIWLNTHVAQLTELLLALALPALFMGFITLPLSAVGDSLAREVWPEKLFTFDALRKRIILFPQFGSTILRGLAIGFMLLGISTVFYKITSEMAGVSFAIDDEWAGGIAAFVPFIYYLAAALFSAILIELTFRLLTLSFFRKYMKRIFSILALSTLLASLASANFLDLEVLPLPFAFLINFVIALIMGFTFIKYDFITCIIAALTPRLFFEGYNLLVYGQDFYTVNGLCLLAILIGMAIIGLVGVLRVSKKDVDLVDLAPPYISQLAERERFQRELEIARNVQLSFLPRRNPSNEKIDIATICIPANEVGGDYFDFVELEKNRIGIVIGDVSGKGISAAFYMTLTKGFFKSQARNEQSPRKVLISLNELLYENIERTTFVSMIYGIFDFTRNTFTFARAGHNPVIICGGMAESTRMLSPKGMALGLEKGSIFTKTIEEYQLEINADDIFVFYTDGFTEAMNNNNEEFGEMRLQNIIENNRKVLAGTLLQTIQQHIESFVGKTYQHDDMTMIIARIK